MFLNAPEESNSSASVEDGVECVDDGRVDNLERVHCTAALLRTGEGTTRANMVWGPEMDRGSLRDKGASVFWSGIEATAGRKGFV